MACLDSNDNAISARNERIPVIILKSQGYQSLVSSSCLYVSLLIISKHSLCKPRRSNSISIVLQSVGDRETEFDDKYIHMPAPLHPRPTFATNRRMFFGFFWIQSNTYWQLCFRSITFILQHF